MAKLAMKCGTTPGEDGGEEASEAGLCVNEEEQVVPLGVSEEALADAVRVIEAVVALPQEAYTKSKRLRPLRSALTKLVWRTLERQGHEDVGSVRKEVARKAHRRAANREKQRAAAFERAAAERCALRRTRQERLEALAAANSAHNARAAALMVPDGCVPDEPMARVEFQRGDDDETVDDETRDASSSPVTYYPACYCCRRRFRERHFFYGGALCPSCAALNYAKRSQTSDMSGATALVTGARIKIGHCVALKLLRAGARVIATSRFPTDALERFRAAPDYATWAGRLAVAGVDFRDLAAVAALADYVDAQCPDGLDVLINNACQTVRRPRAAYADLVAKEHVSRREVRDAKALPTAASVASSRGCLTCDDDEKKSSTDAIADSSSCRIFDRGATTELLPVVLPQDSLTKAELAAVFPPECVDAAGQQLDARDFNSWKMTLADVPLPEAAECFAVNALAPMTLTARLKPALVRRSTDSRSSGPRFVVQVSAMEAKFHRIKSIYHPHTNAAKAALNMICRTSAADYARDRVFMNAVDTGWINDERPLPEANRVHKDSGFQTPIDEVDAAARILDPIFAVLNGDAEPFFGLFLKDYSPTDW